MALLGGENNKEIPSSAKPSGKLRELGPHTLVTTRTYWNKSMLETNSTEADTAQTHTVVLAKTTIINK